MRLGLIAVPFGARGRIAERIEAWKGSPVTSMLLGAGQPEALRLLAERVL